MCIYIYIYIYIYTHIHKGLTVEGQFALALDSAAFHCVGGEAEQVLSIIYYTVTYRSII